MLDKTNITFLSERFLVMYAYYLIGSNENDCSSHGTVVMAILASILAVNTTIAVTDNNTNTGTRGGANDRSNVVTDGIL